jgi:hypothetical protein
MAEECEINQCTSRRNSRLKTKSLRPYLYGMTNQLSNFGGAIWEKQSAVVTLEMPKYNLMLKI